MTGGAEARLLRALSLAGLALAVFVRAFALADKPFWQDEAWLVLLVGQPLPDLLAVRSPVPLGFALAVKASGLLPGPPEVTLRLLPLIAGIATVVVVPLLARALGADSRTQVITLWIAAGAPALVNYSRELKHYGLDVLFGAAFALLAVRLLGGRDEGAPSKAGRSGVGLTMLAAAVPWFCYGAVFSVSAVLAWGWCARWPAAPGVRRRWAAASAAFLLSFAATYAWVIRHQVANPGLRSYWSKSLRVLDGLPLPLGLAKGGSLLALRSAEFLFPWIWPAALALAAVGLVRGPRAGRPFLLWWAGVTALLAAIAVVSGSYVLSGRLLLFTAPLLIIPAAIGLVEAGRWLRAPRAFPLAVALTLACFWSYQAVEHRLRPAGKAGFHFDRQPRLEALMATVESLHGSGHPVYVTRRLVSRFGVYARGRVPDATLEPRRPAGVRAAGHEAPLVQWLGTLADGGSILLSPKDRERIRRILRDAGWEVHGDADQRGVLVWRVTPGVRAAAPAQSASPEGD